ncbi:MAG TPA: PaaI family thioesterase [Burkholderiales bacterium]|nr:PaaI family thioesterase [Burkholderiales bacterium]
MSRAISVSWSDPAALAAAGRRMSGIDFLRAVRDGELPPPPIALLLGMQLAEVEDGRAVFACLPGEQHYNPIGVVHGGLAMTLLDSAMTCAIQTRAQAGSGFTTVEAKTNFVRPITAATGRIRAIGTLIHAGNRLASAEGRVLDDSGKLYAHATTTCIVLNGG